MEDNKAKMYNTKGMKIKIKGTNENKENTRSNST